MTQIGVACREDVDPDEFALLQPTLRHHVSLQDALDWSQSLGLRPDAVDLVIQDEYTHDVVVEISESLFVVYDST